MATQILRMPNPSTGDSLDSFYHNGVVVVVGANGSGKSRLGTWLENPEALAPRPGMPPSPTIRQAYRIGAQRLLTMPGEASRLPADRAAKILQDGHEGPITWSRVQGDPVVGQTNDFAALVNALFADQDRLATEYYAKAKTGLNPLTRPSEDRLDHLRKLWDEIFPERTLVIGDHSLSANSYGGSSEYAASNLSDGERVGFYLIGHVLMAPTNSRIVIDEPELHLHPSIQSRLWNSLEAARTDCTFIYITHDLAFAASRVNAPVVVLFDYTAPSSDRFQLPHDHQGGIFPSPGHWRWQLAPRADVIPADVTLRILGSRHTTLFVEGDNSSLDLTVYKALFPNKNIVPAGNCDQVARATRAFGKIKSLHHIEPTGLIDRDDRDDDQVMRLQAHGIFVLPVAGVENLLALNECMYRYLESKGVPADEQNQLVLQAQARSKHAMRQNRDLVIAERAQYALRRRLQSVRREGNSLEELRRAFDKVTGETSPEALYAEAQATVDAALQSSTEYLEFLAIFRNKAILTCIAREFGVSRGAYKDAILGLLRQDSTLRQSLCARIFPPGCSNGETPTNLDDESLQLTTSAD